MLTGNAFDDRENKQINMAHSIHKFNMCLTGDWGLIHLNSDYVAVFLTLTVFHGFVDIFPQFCVMDRYHM